MVLKVNCKEVPIVCSLAFDTLFSVGQLFSVHSASGSYGDRDKLCTELAALLWTFFLALR